MTVSDFLKLAAVTGVAVVFIVFLVNVSNRGQSAATESANKAFSALEQMNGDFSGLATATTMTRDEAIAAANAAISNHVTAVKLAGAVETVLTGKNVEDMLTKATYSVQYDSTTNKLKFTE